MNMLSFIIRALEQLNYLGALDDEGVLTDLGTYEIWLYFGPFL